MKFTNNKNSIKGLWIYIALIVFLIAVIFMLFSSMFERNAPKIKVQNEIYWNFQKPINVTISDNIKIKSYEMVFVDGDKKIKLDTKVIKEENFKALTLEQQKEMFLTMLDLNQMYVQYSEMTDSKYCIDKVFQELTNKFYSDK